ncbi:hypothetical protein KRMM14A1259_39820 [Krasilnikovia sp. MM14-A1259]
MQVGLVTFRGEDPVGAAFGEVRGVVTLAVQRVRCDHHAAQVADLVKQRPEPGDLIGLVAAVGAGQDRFRVLIARCEDVLGASVGSA